MDQNWRGPYRWKKARQIQLNNKVSAVLLSTGNFFTISSQLYSENYDVDKRIECPNARLSWSHFKNL
jgi:hypothetical protein